MHIAQATPEYLSRASSISRRVGVTNVPPTMPSARRSWSPDVALSVEPSQCRSIIWRASHCGVPLELGREFSVRIGMHMSMTPEPSQS